jgi:ribosomal protein S18 acetylase RimI-like enzyme
MGVTIREFELEHDYDAAIALWSCSGPGLKVGRSDTRQELAKKLARDPDLFLVAECDGQLVGTVIGGFDGRRGVVYHLAVAEAQRKQGIGARLMDEVEARLIAKGCIRAYLAVMPDNPEVFPFYERRGWSMMPVQFMAKNLVEPGPASS